MFPADISDNIRSLQKQIDRINTARPGPTSYGPNDGHLRFHDGNSDAFYVSGSGAMVRHRGSLTWMTPLLEYQSGTLDAHGGRLTGHDTTLGQHASRMDGIDSTVAKKAWTTYVDQQDGALGGRIDGVVTTLGQKAWTSYVDQQDSALSGRVSTAQSRADAAHALAASKANVSYVDTKASTEALYELRRAVREWMAAARAQYPNMPAPIAA